MIRSLSHYVKGKPALYFSYINGYDHLYNTILYNDGSFIVIILLCDIRVVFTFSQNRTLISIHIFDENVAGRLYYAYGEKYNFPSADDIKVSKFSNTKLDDHHLSYRGKDVRVIHYKDLKKCVIKLESHIILIKFHSNGFLKEFAVLHDKKRIGPYMHIAENGLILSEGFYDEYDVRHGPWRIRRNDGSMIEGYYNYNHKVNIWREYKNDFIVDTVYPKCDSLGVFILPISGPII